MRAAGASRRYQGALQRSGAACAVHHKRLLSHSRCCSQLALKRIRHHRPDQRPHLRLRHEGQRPVSLWPVTSAFRFPASGRASNCRSYRRRLRAPGRQKHPLCSRSRPNERHPDRVVDGYGDRAQVISHRLELPRNGGGLNRQSYLRGSDSHVRTDARLRSNEPTATRQRCDESPPWRSK